MHEPSASSQQHDGDQDDTENEDSLETNHYTVLGLSRTATLDEINAAYRKLSLMTHPDKHYGHDKDNSRDAVSFFNKVQKAHEILSDAKKRALYDTLGHEGLKLSDDPESMQLITSASYADEMRERFKCLEKIAKEAELAKLSRPQGSISVNINAIELFDYFDESKEEEFIDEDSLPLPNVSVTSIDIHQSASVPSAGASVNLAGDVNVSKGDGSGHMSTGFRRIITDSSWIEVAFVVGRGPIFMIKGFRALGQKSTVNANIILPIKLASSMRSGSLIGVIPLVDLVFGRKISDNLHASVSLEASMARVGTSLTYNWGKSQFRLHCSRRTRSWSTKVECSYPLELLKAKVRLVTGISSNEYSIQYGIVKDLTKVSSIAADIVVGTASGVTLKVKYAYGSQSFLFNFLLYDEILLSAIFYGTIAPFVAYSCVNGLIVEPYKQLKEREKNETEKVQNSARLAEMQKEASALQTLWQSNYEKSVQHETETNGLVIIKAIFGSTKRIKKLMEDKNFAISTHLHDLFDVTIPLQCQVRDSSLHLPTGSKIHYPGFCDPCFKEEKELYIQYSYRGDKYETVIANYDAVSLPKPNET